MNSHSEIKDALERTKNKLAFLKKEKERIDLEVQAFLEKHEKDISEHVTLARKIKTSKEEKSTRHNYFQKIISQKTKNAANDEVTEFDEMQKTFVYWQKEALSRIKQEKEQQARFAELEPIYKRHLELSNMQAEAHVNLDIETVLYNQLKTKYTFAYGRYKAAQNTGFIDALAKNDMKEAKSFLNAGADINIIGDDHLSPLFRAIKAENAEQVEWLLRHHANPNQKLEYLPSFKGITPFIATIAWTYDNSAIARYLLAYKANVNMGDAMEFTPLHAAMYFLSEPHANFLLLLRETNIKVNMKTKDIYGRTPLDILELRKSKNPHAYADIQNLLHRHSNR